MVKGTLNAIGTAFSAVIDTSSASPEQLLDACVGGGVCKGAQLAVTVRGEEVISHAAGQARPGVPMSAAIKCRLDCAVKPVLAMGVLWLAQRGLLSVETPVKTYLPEFGVGGKDLITPHHLLTHTSGVFTPKDTHPYLSSPAMLRRRLFAAAIGDWVPGAIAEYDTWGGWFTLAEIVERVTTVPWADFLTKQILWPAGIDSLELVPGTGPDPHRLELPYRCPRTGESALELRRLDRPQALAYPNPAYGGYAPMTALARLYDTFRQPQRCQDILGFDPTPMTIPQRPSMYDRCLRAECAMAYGMFVGLDRWNFSNEVSRRAFGHPGNAGTWAVCDPDADIVIALRMNGAPRELTRDWGAYRSAHGHAVFSSVYRAIR